jgi:16S rRNA (guanine(1405)-N(7))-methyltransferase
LTGGGVTAPLDRVVTEVAASRRYRGLCDSVIRRAAVSALVSAEGDVRDAIKRTKRALHQVHGAYLEEPPRYARLLRELARARESGEGDELAAVIRRILGLHGSTRERLTFLDLFFSAIFERAGRLTAVMDLACGLLPLYFPFAGLQKGVLFRVSDIDRHLIAFVDEALTLLGVRHEAGLVDLLEPAPIPPSDLALLLKTLPCLEQQEAGSSAAVLRRIPARQIVVSFPTLSLGGRGKGMRANYAAWFEDLSAREGHRIERLEFPRELVYLVSKDDLELPTNK